MTETFEELTHRNKERAKKLLLCFFLIFALLTLITHLYGPTSILNDFQERIANNFADYRIVKNSSEINEKARISKEKLYFAGDGLAIAPFVVRIKTMENHKAAFLETNHYFFWLFGYHKQFTMSNVEIISKDTLSYSGSDE